ncbi:hypothetical protein EBB07_18850 [Paenibacillaceae bacterium]|nr:hypothetical protein EBB07_18850 [Paenibacillaceae bacterium]
MPFDEAGFLGDQIVEWARENYHKHKFVFDVGFELNKYAYVLRNSLTINSENGQQVISSTLFSRIHNGFQTTLVLYKMGLETEAKVILRTILEASFILKAVTNNEEEVVNFINTDKRKQKQLLEIILEKDNFNIYKDLKSSLNKEQLEQLKQEIKEEDIKDVKVYEWANRADMAVFYAFVYRILSSDVHTDIRVLEKYLVLDEEKQNVIGIDSLPNHVDIVRSLFTAYSIMIISLNCLNELFELQQDNILQAYEEKIMKVRE